MKSAADYWLAKRIGAPRLFTVGATDPGSRVELLRVEIVGREIGDQRLGTNPRGDDETIRQFFERVFEVNLETGEPLNA